MGRFLERFSPVNLFYKKRYLLKADKLTSTQLSEQTSELNQDAGFNKASQYPSINKKSSASTSSVNNLLPDFYIEKITLETITEEVNHFLQERIMVDVLLKRLVCPDIDLFVTFQKHTGKPIGYYWALTANQNSYWHDSFRIPINSALVFNAFVTDDTRRKGVYAHLIDFTHRYLFNERKCAAVFTIVEKRNTASLNANQKANLVIYKTNHLIKFLGKNVFSIYTNDEKETFCVLFKKSNTIP